MSHSPLPQSDEKDDGRSYQQSQMANRPNIEPSVATVLPMQYIHSPSGVRPAGSQPSPAAADLNGYPGAAIANVGAVPAPVVPQPQLLPFGATPFNGGVLYSANVFANSYRVPGPGGKDYVYYDRACPMPPVHAYPSFLEQWHQLTRWLKLFVILLLVFWVIQLGLHFTVGICLPILFLPTYLLYRYYQRHYESIELYLLVKMYALAFVPGALVCMLVESVLTILFLFICFQSYIGEFLQKMTGPGAGGGATSPPSDDGGSGGGKNGGTAPEGLEFLNFEFTPALFFFLFLLSYISAGCVEESLKYWCTNRIKGKYRPAYRAMHGICIYAVAAALGFSTIENIGYVVGPALAKGGDSSFVAVLLNTLGRTCISTPLHLLTAYLIGLNVVRRDILGEPLNIVQVMGWPVFFHGTFDFGLFLVMALQSKWSSGDGDDAVSYVLMACVVLNCYAGLAYCIWRTRRIVFPHGDNIEVEHAVDVENPPAGSGGVGAAHLSAASPTARDGFARLEPDGSVGEAQA
jgi:RsiW-degrading membrane proteinase PrsW (M82 family)